MSPVQVFVVGRFRSGTTALWNILRQAPEVFGIYEPLHDQLLPFMDHHLPPDSTHHGVTDYFRELRPHREQIAKFYQREFGSTRLALGADDDYPPLKSYLQFLMTLAETKIPVFKFVRADFRLSWLKRNFPDAVILYIWRNPREQWISTTRNRTSKFAENLQANAYYLNTFAANLMLYVPELMSPGTRFAYERSYLLWRISKAVGEKYADIVIDFDGDFTAGDHNLFSRISALTGIPIVQSQMDCLLLRQRTLRWPDHADQVPFDKIEQQCESILNTRGILQAIKAGALDKAWPIVPNLPFANVQETIHCLNLMYCNVEESRFRDELRAQALDSAFKRSEAERTALGEKLAWVEAEYNAFKERTAQVEAAAHAEEQALFAQLARYQAESATFGAQVGRWLTRQRNRLAPVGTFRGTLASLMARTTRIAYRQGIGAMIWKVLRYMARRTLP